MPDERTAEPQPWKAPTKEQRRAERQRIVRHSRLPGPFFDYAQRGRREAFLVSLLQITLVLAVTLLPAKLLTGSWLPPGAALLALTVGFAVQFANRYLNARAGRS